MVIMVRVLARKGVHSIDGISNKPPPSLVQDSHVDVVIKYQEMSCDQRVLNDYRGPGFLAVIYDSTPPPLHPLSLR